MPAEATSKVAERRLLSPSFGTWDVVARMGRRPTFTMMCRRSFSLVYTCKQPRMAKTVNLGNIGRERSRNSVRRARVSVATPDLRLEAETTNCCSVVCLMLGDAAMPHASYARRSE